MGADVNFLIDRIYEAAAFPSLWPETLDEISKHVRAMGGIIGSRSRDDWWGSAASTALLPSLFAEFSSSPRAQQSVATLRVMEKNRAGFVTSEDVFAPGEWEEDPLYIDWIAATGGGSGIATAIHAPTGEFIIVHFHRRKGEMPFSRSDREFLDTMRPHLARAGLLAARWRLERLRAAAEALALIGLPALIVGNDGRVLAANTLIERMDTLIKWLPRDHVALTDPAANGLLRQALAGLRANGPGAPQSFPAKTPGALSPVVIHVTPTPGKARDLFDGALAVITVTPVASGAPPSEALIRGLFDLTPGEARVAQGIVSGLTIDEMAEKGGIGRETIRSHMKGVFAKTGTNRQSEAAALLSGIHKLPVAES